MTQIFPFGEDCGQTACQTHYRLSGTNVCRWCGEELSMDDGTEKIKDLELENSNLRAENTNLTTELVGILEDLSAVAQERNTLQARSDVSAYTKLGAENLALLGRVRELEAALFAANEEIDDLRVELSENSSYYDNDEGVG